jgi:A/G-specific adenine glycosylase
MDREEFHRIIYDNYEKEGRDFPWRKDAKPSDVDAWGVDPWGVDAWGVLVSEFMLQQTQTNRVISYWERWMKLWPDPAVLAAASLEDALREWSGLGYNRRARYLKDCARVIAEEYGNKVPDTPETLLPLPGIGPYTAGAIACFAYNYPAVFIETNIRAVMLHFFFKEPNGFQASSGSQPPTGSKEPGFQAPAGVSDADIFPLLEDVLDRENPRRWYYALMDYGAALKKVTANPNRRSAHYVRQSPFEGSFRQLRGALIRSLVSQGPATAKELHKRTGMEDEDLYRVLDALGKELLVAESGGVYSING